MKAILEEDLRILDDRVRALRAQIFELGEEFNVAVTQSSETWHDNAPFDAAVDKQALLHQELITLQRFRQDSLVYRKKRTKKIQIGSKITLQNSHTIKLMIGGDWIGRDNVDGYRLITCNAPIAQVLLGRVLGDVVSLPTTSAEVRAIH